MTGLDRVRRRIARCVLGDDCDRDDGRCRHPPEWLVLVVNGACNMRCRMCDVGLGESASVFYRHLMGGKPGTMRLSLLETVLEGAVGFSPRPRIGLAYTEPLMHPQIVEFSRAIVGAGCYCSITTNGFLLPRLADALVEVGVHEIAVSVDGPEEIHDRVRGRSGSFRRLYEGVERLNRAKRELGRSVPVVRLSYTLTDQNDVHMVELLRQVEGLGAASLSFSHLNFVSAEMADVHNGICDGGLSVTRSNLGSMDLAAIELGAMWQALEELKAYVRSRSDLPPVTVVPDFTSPAGLETYYRDPLTFVGGRQCTDPWRMMMIRTDGSVVPAHARCYEVMLGNAAETPLAELWNNHRVRRFRQTLKEAGGTLPACARCCGVIGKAGNEGTAR